VSLEPLHARYDGYAEHALGQPGGMILQAEVIRGIRGTIGRQVKVMVNRDRYRGLVRSLAQNFVAGHVYFGDRVTDEEKKARLLAAATWLRQLAAELDTDAGVLDKNEMAALRRALGRDQ